MTHSPDGASAGGLDLDELEKQLRLAVRRATLVYSDGSPYGVQQAADDAWALVLRALSPSPGLGEEGIPGSPSAHVADATATEALCDLEEAIRLAEIGEYLYDAKAFVAGDGYHEPREFSINWEWQQCKPDTYGEGALLAEATAWHQEMCETGVETQAARLRRVLAALSSEAPSPKSEGEGR